MLTALRHPEPLGFTFRGVWFSKLIVVAWSKLSQEKFHLPEGEKKWSKIVMSPKQNRWIMCIPPCTVENVVTWPCQAARDAGKCSLAVRPMLSQNFITGFKKVRKDFGGVIPPYGVEF